MSGPCRATGRPGRATTVLRAKGAAHGPVQQRAGPPMARKHRTGPCHGPGQKAGPNLTGQMYIYTHTHSLPLCLPLSLPLHLSLPVSPDAAGHPSGVRAPTARRRTGSGGPPRWARVWCALAQRRGPVQPLPETPSVVPDHAHAPPPPSAASAKTVPPYDPVEVCSTACCVRRRAQNPTTTCANAKHASSTGAVARSPGPLPDACTRYDASALRVLSFSSSASLHLC